MVGQGKSSIRLAPIQALRGIAALLVVCVHAIAVTQHRLAQGLDTHPAWTALHDGIRQFGASGVDLFFIISGFVMAMMLRRDAVPGGATFLRDRFVRIVPLFWLAALFYALEKRAFGEGVEPGEMLAGVTILPPGLFSYQTPVLVVGWSLGFELVFYAIVCCALPLARRYRLAVVALMLLVTTGVALAAPMPPGLFAIAANPIQIEFLLGIAAYALWDRWHETAPGWAAPALLWVGAGFLLLTLWTGVSFSILHQDVITGAASLPRVIMWALPWFMVLLALILRRRDQAQFGEHGLWRLLGDASYSIYLVHIPLCYATEHLVPRNALAPDAVAALALVVSLLLGILVHRTIETPMLAYFKRRKGRATPVALAAA